MKIGATVPNKLKYRQTGEPCRWHSTRQRGFAVDHPGEILQEDFIQGFDITQNKLAVSIGVPPRRINEIVHGKRGITADTAIRLARYFGTSEEFWMNLQSSYELRLQRRALRDQVAAITPLRVA